MADSRDTRSAASSPAEARSRTAALDSALLRLRSLATGREAGDGIVFAGNPHESVPRALFLDARLTPLERNAWAVIRLMLNEDGITAYPSYAQLRPFLASVAGSENASDETVARALTVLRLTRWLSLARHRRDATTGRLLGNLYVLHDEPLSPYEALKLDLDYLELVSRALTHASRTIRHLSCHVLNELTEDSRLSGEIPRTRLEGLLERITCLESNGTSTLTDPAKNALARDDNSPAPAQRATPPGGEKSGDAAPRIPAEPSSESEEGSMPSSDSEDGANSLKTGFLRNPKKDSTVRTVLYEDLYKEIRTVPRAGAGARVSLPERFARLPAEQQAGALAALQPLETTLQQAVLDEWEARCRESTVRKPAGYLFALIQRALRGEFRAWAGQAAGRTQSGATPEARDPAPAEAAQRRAQAQQHIAKLKALLAIRS
jgi:hypothetical protein